MKRFAPLILAAGSIGAAKWAQELEAEDADSAMAWSRDGTQWRTDNDALTSFVKSVCKVTE